MRELLIERDYDDISTSDVLERAGASRGGMYHHFDSKLDLFQAAFETSEREVLARLSTATFKRAGDKAPFDLLLAACVVYLEECARGGELARIGLRQSRAVLGWERWREVATPLGIASFGFVVEAAAAAGELETADVTITTHLVLAALIDGALLIATSPNPRRTLAKVQPEIVRFVSGLRRA
jgi:AcrR family transcriptional regulator